MRRSPRVLLLIVAFGWASACGGEPVPIPTEPAATTPPAAATPEETPTQEPSPSPAVGAKIRPPGIPTVFAKDVPSGDLPLHKLVPLEALVTGTWYVPSSAGIGEQVVIAYTGGEDPDPFATDDGLVVWQRYPERPIWRAVHGFFDPASREVLGIDVPTTGDVTGDGHDDLLTFESTGGSGACGVWRVLATDPETGSMTAILKRKTCDGDVTFDGRRVILTEAVFEPGDAHCCPSATRRTTMRWTGARWKVISSKETPT